MRHEVLKSALEQIFMGIAQLREVWPKKEFTIDGRLVGDIGEVLVQRDYDLVLYDRLVRITMAKPQADKRCR